MKNCAATAIPICRASPTSSPSPLPATWTPQQEQALAKVVNIDEVRRVWMGSLEITELIRRQLAQEISSLGVSSFGVSSLSSPFGGMEKAKGFWFNVNAELIIYGATEPDAKVTLGGHEIKLRSDGTFSFRFALPDGKYDLPAVAVSADGDGRARGRLEIQPRDGISRRCRCASARPVAQDAAAGKPVISMDAPERGALMLVRFIAAVAHRHQRWLNLRLYWVVEFQRNHTPMKIFPCIMKSIPALLGIVVLIKSKTLAQWVSDKLDE